MWAPTEGCWPCIGSGVGAGGRPVGIGRGG